MKIKDTPPSGYGRVLLGLIAGVIVVVMLTAFFQYSTLGRKVWYAQSLTVDEFVRTPATLPELLSYFNNDRIYLAVSDEATNRLSSRMRKQFRKLDGTRLADLGFREAYVGFYLNGKFVEEHSAAQDSVTLRTEDVQLVSAGHAGGGACRFEILNRSYRFSERGLHVFVRPKHQSQIYHYHFDFYAATNPAVAGRLLTHVLSPAPLLNLELDAAAYERITQTRDRAMQEICCARVTMIWWTERSTQRTNPSG